MSDDLSPIRKQYLDIKRQYPDTILFFRLGDFYETFDADAEITSRELEIVLTARHVAKGIDVPMAGIPYHALENYLGKLIDKGYHVAICEQVGEQPARGLFPRQVTRVVTPGTIVEPTLLHGNSNNYLAGVVLTDNNAGIAYADITTGEFFTTEIHSQGDILSQIRSELTRLNPAEILVPDTQEIGNGISGHTTQRAAWHFEPGRCRDMLMDHFKVGTLDGFGLRDMPLAVRAAGAILQYIQDTQPQALSLLTKLSSYSISDFMALDANTRRNLELTETIRQGNVHGSLLGVLDLTRTPMGQRLMRQWVSKPLLDIPAIQTRQDSLAFLMDEGIFRASLRLSLHRLADLERLVNRVLSSNAIPRDLASIRSTLHHLQETLSLVNALEHTRLLPVTKRLDPCKEERELLEHAISEDPPATLQNTGIIRTGYSTELDNIIEASQHAREWIGNLESIERDRTGIKSLKVGYNKVFGYYIEVTHSNTAMIPEDYIRKQTLVNAERYITPQMKEYETLVLNAEEPIREVEHKLFREICTQLSKSALKMLDSARALAELDVLASLAEVAALNGYVRPEITNDSTLNIINGRHPVVEKSLSGERFMPNDAAFEDGEIIRLITGPNMSGKSTFLRQAALIILMAQMGSYVPVSSARIGLVDRIFTRIGAQDEIHAGQSTFMVEMVETANILNHATPRSLLILDEIGRGTSTYDGVSIAWAVLEYIHNHPAIRARTLFATHYHELTQLSEILPGIRNYNVAVVESDGKVIFLHKILPGATDRSYGIHVGQLAGLPASVVQRAAEILKQLETSSGKAIQLNPQLPKQMTLFPETNPLLSELNVLDLNTLSPLEALNKLYEWKRKFTSG
jgi:DNA mismatch repair protein MutS